MNVCKEGSHTYLSWSVIVSCEELSLLEGGKIDDISDELASNISWQAGVPLKNIEHASQ